MSTNNYILIQETEKGFKIEHRDMDVDIVLDRLGTHKTLRKAIEIANKFSKKLSEIGIPVEYGLEIRFLEEEK